MAKVNKSVSFMTFEQFHGRRNIGSSRIRARWVIDKWDEAELFVMGKPYDVVILQKAYWLEFAEMYKGIKILDICDADFLHWGYRIRQVAEQCHAVTTSTKPIKEYMEKFVSCPVYHIPDRINFDTFTGMKKNHKGNGKTRIVSWYGYSDNFQMIDSALNTLLKCGIEELHVIATPGAPYNMPPFAEGKIRIINYPWNAETVNLDLLRADVVLNPKSATGRFKYKSNNKTICAWALGIPVAHTKAELDALMTEEARIEEGEKRYKEVREEYDIRQSVEQYKQIIEDIKSRL